MTKWKFLEIFVNLLKFKDWNLLFTELTRTIISLCLFEVEV